MSDFITNGAAELPPAGDDGKVRPASLWGAGDTFDIHQCLLDLRTATITAKTGWDDLYGPITSAQAGLSVPTTEAFGDTGYPATFFRHDQDDEVYWTFQTSHRWDRTTSLYFHLHVIPMGDPVSTQNVIIDGAYVWMHYGQTVPALSGWTAIDPVTHPVAHGDIMKPAIIPVATIPPGTALESDILVIRVRRPGSSNASDTYTTSKAVGTTAAANLCVLAGDCHYYVQKAGTVNEIPS